MKIVRKVVYLALGATFLVGLKGNIETSRKFNQARLAAEAQEKATKVVETAGQSSVVEDITDFLSGLLEDKVEGEVVRVKDGDTYVINFAGVESTVRLIGVDTPESVHSDANRNTNWGKKISKIVKKKIKSGTKVKLSFDEAKEDKYGRVLAYVYQDGTMINKWLVKNGYARTMYVAPNGKYRKAFEKLQKGAKEHKRGFWADGYEAAFPS